MLRPNSLVSAPAAVLLSVLLSVPLSSGCHISLGGSGVTVDGVELKEESIEELSADVSLGFEVTSPLGDIRIVRSAEPTKITVKLFEKTRGDAYAVFEDGELTSRSRSGEPSALGDVTVSTNDSIARLVLTTGMGDIEVSGVDVDGEVSLDTGMGDVSVGEIGQASEVSLNSGMGDIEVSNLTCTTLEASSGIGDVEVSVVEATTAELSSGLGDVDVHGSKFDRLEADTGLGDVDLRDTVVEDTDLSTGLGEIR